MVVDGFNSLKIVSNVLSTLKLEQECNDTFHWLVQYNRDALWGKNIQHMYMIQKSKKMLQDFPH